MESLLIYTHQLSPRLQYTLDLVFKEVLLTGYEITTDINYYNKHQQPRLAYTIEAPEHGLFIKSSAILFENKITSFIPKPVGTYGDFPVFFEGGTNSALPVDVFATVFYFATRYEEYLARTPDKHGRFRAEDSLAFKHGFLQKPFLNYLISDFANILQRHYPELKFERRQFNFLSTIDIDNAYAYAHKGFARNTGALFKEVLTLKWQQALRRIQSNVNDKKDPYNTFERIRQFSSYTQTALQFFVLIGDYSTYDKNPSYLNNDFRKLLLGLSHEFKLGLHPSYISSTECSKIKTEQQRLEDITGKKVTSARCHFLKVNLPQTYQHFQEYGIMDDYTMIFASQCGFRTGLCVPYTWYDLQREQKTRLTIHTSTVMEGVLRDYNQLSAGQAWLQIETLMAEVKKFGGEFVSVWHNDSFVNEQEEWINVYKQMLQLAKH